MKKNLKEKEIIINNKKYTILNRDKASITSKTDSSDQNMNGRFRITHVKKSHKQKSRQKVKFKKLVSKKFSNKSAKNAFCELSYSLTGLTLKEDFVENIQQNKSKINKKLIKN
jgi:hypothetical protein